ncbi:MAG: hypothetical protein FWE63_01695 [Bacteroidales bacterium]|nr:hypothetical protein [Bacteroidales bacterium]
MGKKAIIILVIINFSIMNAQVNHLETLKNEYWSKPWEPRPTAHFSNFYFFEDGTFAHEFGYSGGVYRVSHVFGKYKYSSEEKKIMLEIEGSHLAKFENFDNTPSTIKIIEITDNSITFTEDNNTDKITMSRRIGITSESYWFEGETSSHNKFSFQRNGYCQIRQNEINYTCVYWLVGGILYLEVITSRPNEE